MSQSTPLFNARLSECHPDLQRVLKRAKSMYDFGITCGHRGEADQNAAFDSGHSRVQWPNSKHNATPSLAVDIVPIPLDWNNTQEFAYMAGVIMACAYMEGVLLTWGGRWTKLKDMPHFELSNIFNRPVV